LVLDDFGTGYSSLRYLLKFPIDALKIDMSFVQGLSENGHDAAVVRTVLAIAREMNCEVIAEGVETEAQLEFLQKHGCDRVQGYFIGRPVQSAKLIGDLTQTAARARASSTSHLL
ncbi:MAG: EAL domain-containing protein, partial [Cyanobacteria bacterium J06639_1]